VLAAVTEATSPDITTSQLYLDHFLVDLLAVFVYVCACVCEGVCVCYNSEQLLCTGCRPDLPTDPSTEEETSADVGC